MTIEERALQAEVSSRVRLTSQGNYQVLGADEIGACALRGRYGDGQLVVLCDPRPFTNEGITEHDHAELLFRLATLAGYPQHIWLVYDHTAMPPLPVWLWKNAPQAVVSVGLLLLFAFWMAYPRFGPLQTLEAPVRREISEHLQAAGQFLWRREQSERLLRGARKSVYRFGRRRIVGWERKSAARQAAELAELLGLETMETHFAFSGTDQGSRRRLLAIVQGLYAIRHRLERSRDH
jgi:hypothetical protein